jgi:hypothetical protein
MPVGKKPDGTHGTIDFDAVSTELTLRPSTQQDYSPYVPTRRLQVG